jgi:hypothetical protein
MSDDLVARNVRPLPRTQDVLPLGMDMDVQVWRDTDYYKLLVRSRRAVERGQIAIVQPIGQQRNKYGDYRMVVKKLNPPSRAPLWALVWAGGISLFGAVAVLLYESRWVLLGAAGVAVCVWLCIKTAGGHDVACPGLHCPGCKG